MPEKLRVLAGTVRKLEVELGACISQLRSGAEDAVLTTLERNRQRLGDLASDLDSHATIVETIDMTVADRMNNFLMAVQTVSDRLRGSTSPEVHDQLRSTVEHGRATVTQIRKSLARM